MDPHSFIARAEAQRWLGISEKLLMSNDFVGSKTFAIRSRESDPRLEAADQILAITDTLLAAEKRVVGNNGIQQPDFYAILQLARFVQDSDHIGSQYRQLAVLLNPNQNRFVYSDQAFQLVNDAYAVLSNPMRKSLYDADLNFPHQINNLGFNIEQHQHQHQQQHQQQQHQHNFFSINPELSDSQQAFQSRAQLGHQQQQQQHNFLSTNSGRAVPQVQLFQHQVQPFQVTSAPQPPQQPSLFTWPQAPPLANQQPQAHHQFQQQQESVQQEAEPEVEAAEVETETLDDSPSFWTTCPYCFYMYEYPRAYAECVLRCFTCKRAFQAVRVPSPPPLTEGQDTYFCCWGFFPLAVSVSDMQKNNATQTNSNWAPFSPMYDVSTHVHDLLNAKPPPKENEDLGPTVDIDDETDQDHLNDKPAPKENEDLGATVNIDDEIDQNHLNDKPAPKKKEYLGPTIYIDDETDDIFDGISEPSDDDDSDNDWNSPNKKKAKRVKKDRVRVTDVRNGNSNYKKASGVTTRRQSGRAAKEMGKLDLNVEFNNNEGEGPTARKGAGNRGSVQGDGENTEGVGFFEGLDEFFSSLPILSVVNDEKVKAG